MKTPHLLLAVLFGFLATALVAKDEVGIAEQKSRRAWESAPAEKQALWRSHRDALNILDISEETVRHVIIARGSPEEYHAHPTTAMLADDKTIFAVWNMGHGGRGGPVARSDDGGLTWQRVDDIMPPNYRNFKNCPSIYRMTDPEGKERLWIFAMRTLVDNEKIKPVPIEGRHQGWMPRVVSEDNGQTWRELPPLAAQYPEYHDRVPHHRDNPFRCVMTFSSIVQLKDGSYLGMFHRATGRGEEGSLQVLQSITRDGGFTWSDPVIVCDGTKLAGDKKPCEPYVFRSPDGNELACIMRENNRTGTSLVMFSQDEGETWSEAVDTPWGLTLDRHHGIYLPDGRLVIVGRNTAPLAPAHFIAWVGTYEDIKEGRPGQHRVSLLRTFHDGFYPGIHLLPDGTIVATTYTAYAKDDGGCSIVSVRFNIDEIDALAAKTSPEAAELHIVKDGVALHLLHPDPGFEILTGEGRAVLEDAKETFVVNARPGDEFTVKIRMAIEKAHRSAATVVLGHGDESSHFGFSGSEDGMFVQGRAFTRETSTAIRERTTPPFILDGDMFDFVMTYRMTSPGMADLDISINGEPFVAQSGRSPEISPIGLRPWRARITIESMTLEGNFAPGGVEARFHEP